MPLKPTGFWSYATEDDRAARGRLTGLGKVLAGALQGKVGRQKVDLFQDSAALLHGGDWAQQIEVALENSTFFVPIVTPGFLQSEWCMKEVALFRAIEERRGRADLIFPIHYIDVLTPETFRREDCLNPDLFDFLRVRQWSQVHPFWTKAPESQEIESLMVRLANDINKALRRELSTEHTLPAVPAPAIQIAIAPPPGRARTDSRPAAVEDARSPAADSKHV